MHQRHLPHRLLLQVGLKILHTLPDRQSFGLLLLPLRRLPRPPVLLHDLFWRNANERKLLAPI